MSYNDNGGFGFPIPVPMPMFGNGGYGFGNGNTNDMFGMLMMLLFFSLFGFGNNGMRGGMPFPFGGMAAGAVAGNTAAEAAAYVGAQNTADKVSAIASGVEAIAGIATANGVKLETVKDQNAAAFSNLNTHLCEAFNNVAMQFNAQTMQGMNMHNATTALLNDMRAESAKCCCESKTLMQSIANQQQYQAATDKCEILGAISASESRILAQLNADKFERMQEKLNAANERIATLKAESDNSKQTQTLLAAIQAGQRGYAPCTPCSPCCNPCVDGIQRAVNEALGTRIGEILFPPTTTTAAA